MTGSDIVRSLANARFTASREAALQDGIQELLSERYPGQFEREYSLSKAERPDFYCAEHGIVVEVKLGTSAGTAAKVFAQLQRYAEYPCVSEIVFATTSRRIASRIGGRINGKPILPIVVCTWL